MCVGKVWTAGGVSFVCRLVSCESDVPHIHSCTSDFHRTPIEVLWIMFVLGMHYISHQTISAISFKWIIYNLAVLDIYVFLPIFRFWCLINMNKTLLKNLFYTIYDMSSVIWMMVYIYFLFIFLASKRPFRIILKMSPLHMWCTCVFCCGICYDFYEVNVRILFKDEDFLD